MPGVPMVSSRKLLDAALAQLAAFPRSEDPYEASIELGRALAAIPDGGAVKEAALALLRARDPRGGRMLAFQAMEPLIGEAWLQDHLIDTLANGRDGGVRQSVWAASAGLLAKGGITGAVPVLFRRIREARASQEQPSYEDALFMAAARLVDVRAFPSMLLSLARSGAVYGPRDYLLVLLVRVDAARALPYLDRAFPRANVWATRALAIALTTTNDRRTLRLCISRLGACVSHPDPEVRITAAIALQDHLGRRARPLLARIARTLSKYNSELSDVSHRLGVRADLPWKKWVAVVEAIAARYHPTETAELPTGLLSMYRGLVEAPSTVDYPATLDLTADEAAEYLAFESELIDAES